MSDDKVLTPEEQEAANKAAMELAKEEAAKEEAIKEAARKAAKEVPEVGANAGEVFHCQYSEPGGAGVRCQFNTRMFEMLLFHERGQHPQTKGEIPKVEPKDLDKDRFKQKRLETEVIKTKICLQPIFPH